MEGKILKMNERLSLKKCKDALGKSKSKFSDAEILTIRDYLYELAQVDYSVFMFNDTKEREAEQTDSENNDLKTAA